MARGGLNLRVDGGKNSGVPACFSCERERGEKAGKGLDPDIDELINESALEVR
jgi:hypothetical protein